MVKTWLVALVLLAVALAGCGTKEKLAPAAPQPTNPAAAPAPAPAVELAAAPATGTRYAVAAQQSLATYTVNEKFLNRELPNDAVGTSSAFKGELVVDGDLFKPSTVTVDLRTLKSDSSRRDSYITNNTLETAKYPEAVFTITGIAGAGKLIDDGAETSLQLAGQMKIHGTEKPMIFDAKVKLQGDTLSVTALVHFKMTEFGITPPAIAGMLTAKDEVKLDVKVIAKKS